MKITKTQLKQIIKEELQSLFSEGHESWLPPGGYADEWERQADAGAGREPHRQEKSREEENIETYKNEPTAKPWRSLTRDQQRTVERKGAEAIYYV